MKSQFSVYDAFAGEKDSEDKRPSFSNLLRVDPNIFRDISTNPALVPSAESLIDEVTRVDLKIIRLKASPWTEDIICQPYV